MKWTFRDCARVILTVAALLLSVNFVVWLLPVKKLFLATPHKSLVTLALFLIQDMLFLLPLYFLVIRKYKLNAAALGFVPIGWFTGGKWVLKGFGLVFLFNLFAAFLTYAAGRSLPGFGQQASHVPLFGESAFDLTIGVIVLVGIAPVIEEIFFRGFLLQTFLQKFSPAIGSFLAAGFFALIHFEFQSIGIIFFLALVINWIFLRTRSVWPCLAFHIINNSLAFLLEWFVWQGYVPV